MAARILPKSVPLCTVFVMASGETIATGLTLDEARKRCRQWNREVQHHEEWATWKQEAPEPAGERKGGAA
jgi:hypothetical protein